MKTIAVLGGGGTGCMMAADNTLRGNRVRLWEDARHWHENLAAVREAGGVELTGNALTGFARIETLTHHLPEAVEGAEVILIAAVARRHQSISAQLAPLLRPGQAVVFSAGNCASIGLRGLLGDAERILTGEMSGNVYPCRMTGKATVLSAFPYKPKGLAAFPAADTARLIDALAGVYDCTPVTNVLEAALNSPNIVVHLAGSLLNAGGIDRDPGFCLYRDGLSEHVLRVMEAVEAEKTQVLEAMGYHSVLHTPFIRQVARYGEHPELELFRSLPGPSSMEHRYIGEDAAFGQSLLCSLAEAADVPIPVTRALMTLAGTVNGVDYLAEGMTLEHLGMGGMNRGEINEHLQTGQI